MQAWITIAKALIAPVSGIIGAVVGGIFTSRAVRLSSYETFRQQRIQENRQELLEPYKMIAKIAQRSANLSNINADFYHQDTNIRKNSETVQNYLNVKETMITDIITVNQDFGGIIGICSGKKIRQDFAELLRTLIESSPERPNIERIQGTAKQLLIEMRRELHTDIE